MKMYDENLKNENELTLFQSNDFQSSFDYGQLSPEIASELQSDTR